MNAESDLERTLSELGNEVAWPAAAGLSTRVAARVSTMPPYRRRWWSSAPRFAFATAAMLLVIAAGTLAWAPARETIADRLGLGDIEITSDHSLPPAGVELALGERVAAGDAAARAGFPVAPPLASLAGPDVYMLVNPWGAQVSYAYRPTDSLPEVGDSGVGLLVSQLQGATTDSFIRKLLGSGSTLEVVDVGGEPGYWIAGEPHGFVYLAPDGSFHEEEIRLAGNVLIWTRGDVTYRIESALPLDRVREIARDLRPPS